MLRASLAVAVLAVLLSGCAGSKGTVDAALADSPGPGNPAGAATLDASSSVPAPTWVRGQWWEWEISFGTSVSDETFCSIVAGTEGAGYSVVTESEGVAKDDAAFGNPLVGSIGRSDLAMDGWGATGWSLLSFPLTDGKTWSSSMPNIAWDILADRTATLAMTATFDAALGRTGGFRIEGTAAGAKLLEAEYVPAIGWFSGLRFYDTDPGEEGLEIGFRAKSFGLNYTGPVFSATATRLASVDDGNGFDDDPTQGGLPFATAQPYTSFTMAGGDGHRLYGFLFAETVMAARAIVLVDPANQERHLASTSTALDSTATLLAVDEPAMAGEWRIVTAGAGGYSQAAGALFDLVLTAGTM